MSKENVDIIKELFEAGPRGDVATIRKYVAADVEWIEPPTPELSFFAAGTYHGLESVLKDVIGPCTQLFDGFRLEAEELLDVGDKIIAVGRFRGKAKNTGKELDSYFCQVWTFKDGKIVRLRNALDTAAWLRALGLELGKRATIPMKQQVASPPH